MVPSAWLTPCAFHFWVLHAICALASQIYLGDEPARSGDARHGAVASENSVCSQIGIDLMKAGGNAADAVRGLNF